MPYLIHLLNVAKLLIQEGFGEEVVVAGLMRDTVEDTDMELADIEAEFGLRGLPSRTGGRPWENRK